MRCAALLLLVLLASAYELPADKKASVLTLDYRGGFGPPRSSDEPYLKILADGSIVAEHVKGGTKLNADELQELLRFVIADHKMMEFDRKVVEKKARGDAYITDQSNTILTLAIKGRSHKVTYNASTWASQQFPKVKELQSLEAVRRRLHSVWFGAQLGAETEKLLTLANMELKKKHPKVAPLTREDLHWIYREKKDLRRVHFARWHSKGAFGAWVTLPKKGQPTVEVFVESR